MRQSVMEMLFVPYLEGICHIFCVHMETFGYMLARGKFRPLRVVCRSG
jgi:hypothetical protein